jgi:predicted nucleotidyltransferase
MNSVGWERGERVCLALLPGAKARADSDVDIYVEFEEDKRTYDNFFALHEPLKQEFGRRVDLVTDKSLSETKARLILPTVRYAALHD